MTHRPGKHLARDVFKHLKLGPRSFARLLVETGYPEAMLFRRLAEWCGEGRVVGRVLGVDAEGRPVVQYRLNPSWQPEQAGNLATEEVADAA